MERVRRLCPGDQDHGRQSLVADLQLQHGAPNSDYANTFYLHVTGITGHR